MAVASHPAPDDIEPEAFAFSAENEAWAREQVEKAVGSTGKFPPLDESTPLARAFATFTKRKRGRLLYLLLSRAQEQEHSKFVPNSADHEIRRLTGIANQDVGEMLKFIKSTADRPIYLINSDKNYPRFIYRFRYYCNIILITLGGSFGYLYGTGQKVFSIGFLMFLFLWILLLFFGPFRRFHRPLVFQPNNPFGVR